ncbi:MAG: DUF937 domain-containing protein [Xanthobacteraceae bacterium]
MAANLVSLVMQFLTPDMIGRIAAALGLDRNKVGSAITGAVPALLAAFNNTATQPGGAQKLADAARQQASTLGNFASVLAAGGESSFLEKGAQMLSSLVGSQNQNALTDAIGRFTGLGQSASGSLLGMLAPIVMGTIAQHQGTTRGADANGIANLFASQKDNIAAALPSDLSSLLSGTGLLNSLGDAARTATTAGSEAMREASATRLVDAARQRGAGATSAPSNWLYWLLPLAAAAALLIYFAVRPTEEVAQQGMSKVQNAAVEAPGLGKQVTNTITSLRSTLDGVSDVASAKAALPRVQDLASQIDKTGGEVGQLSADQRKQLSGLIDPLMPALNQLCDKVLAIPGVAEVLKPSVDAVRAKLATLVA